MLDTRVLARQHLVSLESHKEWDIWAWVLEPSRPHNLSKQLQDQRF
jgi:hypothetical protein